jgi:hypothetical protein
MSRQSRKRRFSPAVLWLVSLLFLTPASWGQPTERDDRGVRPPVAASPVLPSRRLALVVGNGNYSVYGKLPNAIHDAQDLASMLGQVGFRVQLEQDVSTVEALDQAVQRFTNQLQPGDLALFYYAGHGAQIERDQRPNYLLPVGFRGQTMADLRERGYLASRVVEMLEDSQQRYVW